MAAEGGDLPEMKVVNDRNREIIAELEATKSKHVTAAFYLNATRPIVNCPDVIGSVFDEDGTRRQGNMEMIIPRGELIPLYIHRLKELAKTSNSQVYDVELLRDNIVIKTSMVGKYDVEFAIGFYFLNSLRAEIPNFMQTYEKFKCGTSKGVCGAGRKQEFLALEKVKGKTVESVIETMSYGDTCLLLLQVYLSLIVANRRFEFCHYDLHASNVMIYDVEPTAITYNVGSYVGDGEENITIVVPFIAVIIDYGYSRVVHNGKVLSSVLKAGYGNRSYADFYNFMEFCMRHSSVRSRLAILQEMIPSMYGEKKEEGLGFSKRVITRLMRDRSLYVSESVYTPTTCKRKKRTSSIKSTLDFYEDYPFSKHREVDVEMILNNAMQQLRETKVLKTYLTYCKLYIFFYDRHVTTNPMHKEQYDSCFRNLEM